MTGYKAIKRPTFEVEITQYLMPRGNPRQLRVALPVSAHPDYLDMLEAGGMAAGDNTLFRFCLEAEMLRDLKTISLTVHDRDGDECAGIDIACEVVPNGPEVIAALVKMLGDRPWRLLLPDRPPLFKPTDERHLPARLSKGFPS